MQNDDDIFKLKNKLGAPIKATSDICTYKHQVGFNYLPPVHTFFLQRLKEKIELDFVKIILTTRQISIVFYLQTRAVLNYLLRTDGYGGGEEKLLQMFNMPHPNILKKS